MATFKRSKLLQKEDMQRRMRKKPMGGPSGLKPKTKGKPRNRKRSLPLEVKKTGGFRKPIYNPKTVKPKGRR